MNSQSDPLVDLSAYDFVLEPVYFAEGLTTDSRMFLRGSVAEKLMRVQKSLSGYRLKIWDAYRPVAMQEALYERLYKDLQKQHWEWTVFELEKEARMFVADPHDSHHVPPHSTGGTVDVTLVDSEGKELAMGTGFDHFGSEAAPFYFEGRKENKLAKENRKILREAMLAEDFSQNEHEWWHFDYGNWKWAAALNRPQAFFGQAEALLSL